ncbi:phosphotransferase family protein [Paenibacillus apiarius]|uniref:phosphotransferase family protein n=1 Tax=Paenibacillus apiarius TaxID=46240 RepID=UPI0019818014|nr:aminoglycoside phosphotransferase family protein [Paenibacillus apiarius]MBN3526709.1 aminoglycoside phosphotransferase family protein [Paenibacillus apiarius]
MDNPITDINWTGKTEIIDDLAAQGSSLTVCSLESGLEAEVIKIDTDAASYVLKVWNKGSRPDVGYQYRLLHTLYERGLAVSKPFGWGANSNGESVLLTSYDGIPVLKVNKQKMTEIAHILSNIHKVPTEELDDSLLRKYDFIRYFYPEIEQFPELHHQLTHLVENANIRQDTLIHGDFNLGNILENEGQYRVIDWTNGQLGDPRYDVAWSGILMRIYAGERQHSVFLSAYAAENKLVSDEKERFEAMACLRWILLDKLAGLPKRADTMKRVKDIIKKNAHLNESIDLLL